MNGTTGIDGTPPTTLGPVIYSTTGEITAAQPVASIPYTGTAGQTIRATVNGIPGGSTDFIFDVKDPAGTRPADDRHGDEPGDHHPDAGRRHVHVRGPGLPG